MPDTLFTIDVDSRTARGLVVPYGEMTDARHRYPAIFNRGTITVPRDITILRANREHQLVDPVATFQSVEDTDRGIEAVFKIADDEDGDALIEAHKRGELTHLSGEFKRLVKRGSEVVSAVLTGAAFTSTPAFVSAGLFTLDQIDEQDTETPDVAPTPEPTPDEEPDEKKEAAVPAATVPELQPLPGQEHHQEQPEAGEFTLTSLFSLLTRARQGDHAAVDELMHSGSDALFALNDVKYDGSGGLNPTVSQPQFLGQLWQASLRTRRIIPAFSSGVLRDTALSGWTFSTKPQVSTWAGNKANIPTDTPAVTAVTGSVQRFAGGNDFAREFIDFGKTDVIEAIMVAYVDSYKLKSDDWFLAAINTAAGTGTAVSIPADTPVGLGKVVQGALAVVNAGAQPSVAIVAPDVYADIVFTKHDNTLEYLNSMIGVDLKGNEATGPGFRIIPHPNLTAGDAIVADRNAITSYELPGTPVRVSALDMIKGGIDEAVFGYIGAMVNDATAIVRIKNAS